MKKFGTLQELWSHMLYCPFCKDMNRNIHVAPGPYELFEAKWFKKVNETLTIRCKLKDDKDGCNFSYHIDTVRNSFILSVIDGNLHAITRQSVNCYFDLLSDCSQCNNSSSTSTSVEFNFREKTVTNIGVELEGLYFLNGKTKYHLTLDHYNNKLLVSRCHIQPDGTILEDNKTANFQLSKFDFSNPKRVIRRIKTLLVFS